MPQSSNTSEQRELPIVVKLNHVIAEHYPLGQVNVVEAVRALMSLATSYQRVLEGREPAAASMIVENALAIEDWLASNPRH